MNSQFLQNGRLHVKFSPFQDLFCKNQKETNLEELLNSKHSYASIYVSDAGGVQLDVSWKHLSNYDVGDRR